MRFTPRNNAFYAMFATSGQNLVVGAGLLKELLGADPAARKVIAEKMRAAEHDGDEATHAIMRELNESFITPFHNMALMSPATTEADVDRHTQVFHELLAAVTRA